MPLALLPFMGAALSGRPGRARRTVLTRVPTLCLRGLRARSLVPIRPLDLPRVVILRLPGVVLVPTVRLIRPLTLPSWVRSRDCVALTRCRCRLRLSNIVRLHLFCPLRVVRIRLGPL